VCGAWCVVRQELLTACPQYRLYRLTALPPYRQTPFPSPKFPSHPHPQRPPRQGPGMLAVPDHHFAVHQH
jgi:hypothetical protein